jgi:hypothetical protein
VAAAASDGLGSVKKPAARASRAGITLGTRRSYE